MKSTQLMFRKAILLLDGGEVERGEELLRNVIDLEKGNTTGYQAMCCLGKLLFENGQLEEAQRFMTIIDTLITEDDVLDFEKNSAKTVLLKIQTKEIKTAETLRARRAKKSGRNA